MFCESLREHAMEMINFKKKKINLSTKEHQESYENAKICYICKDKYEGKYAKDKKHIVKIEVVVIIQENIEVLHILYTKKFL